jgi:hypothetical protein
MSVSVSDLRPGETARSSGVARWALHPVLFAAASALVLYASNLRETHFSDIAPTLAVAVVCALALLVVFAAATRSFGPRAAILASLPLLGALYHIALFQRVDRLFGGALPNDLAAPLTIAIVAALMVFVAWTRFDLTLPNAVLNGIALVLIATPLWSAAQYAWATAGMRTAQSAEGPASTLPLIDRAAATPAATNTPDIYYLIFDRYGSGHTLWREYGFDNRPFLDGLRERGFYVASDSHANYPKTAPSLASTFNMDYLDFADDPLAARNEWHPIYDMLEGHRVGAFLQSRGYREIQIGGWWSATQDNDAADENYSFGLSEFAWLYLRRTIVPKLIEAAAPGSALAGMTAWDNGQCRRVPLQFEKVKEISERPEATFTFVHILLPHEPYVFNSDGECLARAELARRGQQGGYVGQLRYANSMIADMVDHLLSREDKPIIILQADEGPYPEPYRTSNRSWKLASDRHLAMKTGILNAYYFPDGDYSALYPEITPVNTFRLVFDREFGTSFGLLPDRLYAFPDYSRIYQFFEITDAARRGDGSTEPPIARDHEGG